MGARRLRCAIEQIVDWHPNLFIEPHLVAFVAVADQYSRSPALVDVQCEGIISKWLGDAEKFRLEVSWHNDTAKKAERLRATMQQGQRVELASIALALVLSRRILRLGRLDVTDYGARADYLAKKRKCVLEVSGTEVQSELSRRHREKAAQARENPFRWNAYVVVCGFSSIGHRMRVSKHFVEEARHGEGKD